MKILVVLLFAAFAENSLGQVQILPTMSKEEVLTIVNCITEAQNPELCEQFSYCESTTAPQVVDAIDKCQEKFLQENRRNCSANGMLYPDTEIPSDVFDCIVGSITEELTEEEMGMMKDFEDCARAIDIGDCKAS